MKTVKPFHCIHSSGTVSDATSNADGKKTRDLLKLEMWRLKDACEYVLYEGRRSRWNGDRTPKSYLEAVASVQAGTLTGTFNPVLNDYLVRPKDFLSWAELKGKSIWETFAELADRRGAIASKPEPQDQPSASIDLDTYARIKQHLKKGQPRPEEDTPQEGVDTRTRFLLDYYLKRLQGAPRWFDFQFAVLLLSEIQMDAAFFGMGLYQDPDDCLEEAAKYRQDEKNGRRKKESRLMEKIRLATASCRLSYVKKRGEITLDPREAVAWAQGEGYSFPAEIVALLTEAKPEPKAQDRKPDSEPVDRPNEGSAESCEFPETPHGNSFQGAMVATKIAKAGKDVLRTRPDVYSKGGKPTHQKVAKIIAADWTKYGLDSPLSPRTIRRHLGESYHYDPETRSHSYAISADIAIMAVANKRQKVEQT